MLGNFSRCGRSGMIDCDEMSSNVGRDRLVVILGPIAGLSARNRWQMG
jgi:hypothetical protein